MAGLSDDDERALFDQLKDEQTQAGRDHIAQTVGDFRAKLIGHGFTSKEAFKLAREMLISLMDNLPGGEGDE